ADVLLVAQGQVMDAGLARDAGATVAVPVDQLEAPRVGDMGHVERPTGPARELERVDARRRLRDDRPAAAVGAGVALPGGPPQRQQPLDDLLVLGVEDERDLGIGQLLEGRQEVAVGYPREAVGVALERRELEGADPLLQKWVECFVAAGLA